MTNETDNGECNGVAMRLVGRKILGKSPSAFPEVPSKLQPPIVSLDPPETVLVHIYSLAADNSDDICQFILIMLDFNKEIWFSNLLSGKNK